MHCPRCGTEFPPPMARGEPRLRCHTCGARLFAWLGDHFGVHDGVATATATRERRSDGVEWWMVLLIAFVLLVVLSCVCLSGATR